ncbi:MAG: D-alanine--D-alanine ligase [Bacteroidales bacterium]|jgi:D-alanine-D-alanine ligase|nr:D-alanine--D-alanine ligase [Bacteroidales bacterium]
MTKKPNIAVISGGDSSEYAVSVKSGKNVFNAIDNSKYTPWLIQMRGKEWIVVQDDTKIADINKADFSFILNGEKIIFDFAYITIHGTPGEDGTLQGYLELLKVSYSSCNVFSSSLTFNKWFCSKYLKNFGVKMAKSIKISKGEKINTAEIVEKLGLPVFVKPNAGGSSFGITKVKTKAEISNAVKNAWQESNDALIEEFIEGTEFTCGLVKFKNKELVFPVTEILPKNEFFDYEAKYSIGAAEEITPARITENLSKKCQQLSLDIYSYCGCSGICRIDYILKNDKFYFLEVNTTPGMTETSFIPQQVSAMGLKLSDVISMIIEEKLGT